MNGVNRDFFKEGYLQLVQIGRRHLPLKKPALSEAEWGRQERDLIQHLNLI